MKAFIGAVVFALLLAVATGSFWGQDIKFSWGSDDKAETTVSSHTEDAPVAVATPRPSVATPQPAAPTAPTMSAAVPKPAQPRPANEAVIPSPAVPPAADKPPIPRTQSAACPAQLVKGSRGEHVRALQVLLTERGYAVKKTGYFGDETDTAVRRFQYDAGPADDGIVGPKTWAELGKC